MKFDPRPFQRVAVDDAADFLLSSEPSSSAKRLYAAPTGVGKSVVEILVQERVGEGCWIVSPRDEIIAGILDKMGCPDDDMLDRRVCTPVRLRNRLLTGALRHPTHLIFDETHHQEADVWQQLDLLTGLAPAIGYTASPYRGTPKSTRAFLSRWGEPTWLITYKEAVDCEYISFPTFHMLPLVDDDVVEVQGAEFEIQSLESATLDRLCDLAQHCKQWYSSCWDRPTVFAMPSSGCCARLVHELGLLGIPCVTVSAQTPKSERPEIFRACEAGIIAIAHIDIVGEGVDLKLRRFVDCAATLSPVRWIQRLGRIMRPTDVPPEYWCTNRNILRHAYILEGMVPDHAYVAAERSFPPTQRAHTRALGMEAIGRFKPTQVKLMSGLNLYVYNLQTVIGRHVLEFCCLVHPNRDPIWACKADEKGEQGQRTFGTWRACEAPTDLKGFASKGSREPTEKQAKWWKKSAGRFGLDPEQELNRRGFVALPVLNDIGVPLR